MIENDYEEELLQEQLEQEKYYKEQENNIDTIFNNLNQIENTSSNKVIDMSNDKPVFDNSYNIKDYETINLFKSNFLLQTKKNCCLFDLQLLTVLMSRIKETDNRDTEYFIKIADIKQVLADLGKINVSGLNTRIRASIKRLYNSTSDYNKLILPNGKMEYILCNWFTYIAISDDLTYVRYKWNEIVAEHLFGLSKNFGIQSLREILLMDKVVSYRLYEIIEANFNSKNIQNVMPFSFAQFKEVMKYDKWKPITIIKEVLQGKEQMNNYSKYFIDKVIAEDWKGDRIDIEELDKKIIDYRGTKIDRKANEKFKIKKLIFYVRVKTTLEYRYGINNNISITKIPELQIAKKGRPLGRKNKKTIEKELAEYKQEEKIIKDNANGAINGQFDLLSNKPVRIEEQEQNEEPFI